MKKAEHSLYKTWVSMKMRCYWTEHPEYQRYGGRGIKVCDEWRNSFETFVNDMGERPPRHSIDRINVNGDYTKGNCRWATPKEQAANRRNTRFVTIEGVPYNLPELSTKYDICDETIVYRVSKGWSFDRVISKERQWARGEGTGAKGREQSYANKRAQTHCKRGHPLDEGNIVRRGTSRHCLKCRHARYKYGRSDKSLTFDEFVALHHP